MNDFLLEPKEKIEKILNFKNLFKINDNKFNSKKINKIKILYGNKEINIGDLFNVIIKENKKILMLSLSEKLIFSAIFRLHVEKR